ncbi:hypothetical protein NQ317_010112 [Molorchus minor]|uniref:VASP tetramerisation domain-containing protein n=1 Tax=Molorchus minor TaxID=1323400 RepID=A0ABQ9JAJ5_9CUCU|nr:hypothetical protein NQ317_010112 [Molorchus minor]
MFHKVDVHISCRKKIPDKDDEDKKAAIWEKTNTLPSSSSKFNSESPKSIRKRFGSASEETILKVNGLSEVNNLSLGPTEMESFKNEIIKEVRKEIAKMKQDILDGKHINNFFPSYSEY